MSADIEFEQIRDYLRTHNNWGRWGDDDQLGALNLITDEHRRAAAALVHTGRAVSMSRVVPKTPAANNLRPAQHFVLREAQGLTDYYGIEYHGTASTHIDALCHLFDHEFRAWGGRKADDVMGSRGATWGGIEHWNKGLITRGVLIDIPRLRGEPYVAQDRPVSADELYAAVAAQGIEVRPGDAIVVYSGRDRWDAEQAVLWGADRDETGAIRRPGLEPSCLRFIRETDCAILAWDMLDLLPHPWGVNPWNVHSALFAFGVALIDNCDLGDLALACREEGRDEFMLMAAPLPVVGGTGSPANPIALF